MSTQGQGDGGLKEKGCFFPRLNAFFLTMLFRVRKIQEFILARLGRRVTAWGLISTKTTSSAIASGRPGLTSTGAKENLTCAWFMPRRQECFSKLMEGARTPRSFPRQRSLRSRVHEMVSTTCPPRDSRQLFLWTPLW